MPTNPYENSAPLPSDTKATDPTVGGDGKFENISDNGSEISDEGYRSLGLIQANNINGNTNGGQLKRTSLHSQTSTEDAEPSGKRRAQSLPRARFLSSLPF